MLVRETTNSGDRPAPAAEAIKPGKTCQRNAVFRASKDVYSSCHRTPSFHVRSSVVSLDAIALVGLVRAFPIAGERKEPLDLYPWVVLSYRSHLRIVDTAILDSLSFVWV